MAKALRIFVLVVLLAAIGWGAYNMALITIKKYTLQQKIIALQAQAQTLSNKHSDLIAFLDSFKDPAMLEQQLKRRLNVKKQGEEVVVLVPANGAPDPVAAPTSRTTDQLLANLGATIAAPAADMPNWRRWWNLFFK